MVSSGDFGTTGTTAAPAGGTTIHGTRGIAGDGGGVSLTAATVSPTDRVRWGPILAGLFAALSTLVVLAVLGAAVAGSAFDPGDQARTYGFGAGIWGAASMLLAFLIGGWLAARSAAVRGHGNGVLNGAMVWVVAIPLMLYMISAAVGAAGRAANAAAQTGAMAANAAAQTDQSTVDQAIPQSVQKEADQAMNQVQGALNQATQVQPGAVAQQATDPSTQERVADGVARSAWGTLAALLLSLAAAALGGYLGARTADRDRVHTGPATA